MGDRAVAALIEARRHKAEKIAKWAERQLDALGKAVPGEAVQISDPGVLADVLRAYGRTRDPDAARIVITFANSERIQVREAARQAVAMMGEPAQWQLRDTYEDFVGQRPPRDWSWERTARELFDRFDRQRLASVNALFEQGKRAESENKLEPMREAFDRLLAENPLFERRAEMAPGYLRYAQAQSKEKRAEALTMARRAERLAQSEELRKKAASLRLTLEALDLLDRGLADQTLLRRALELDPENQQARLSLRLAERGEQKPRSEWSRYLAAGIIGLSALGAMIVLALGIRRGQKGKGAEAGDARKLVSPAPGSGGALGTKDEAKAEVLGAEEGSMPVVPDTSRGAALRGSAAPGSVGGNAAPRASEAALAPEVGEPSEPEPTRSPRRRDPIGELLGEVDDEDEGEEKA